MRQHTISLLVILPLVLGIAVAAGAQSALEPDTGQLCGPNGCGAVIAESQYEGRKAYTLRDGHSEAIIVPELGRIMSYRLIEGPNLLWTATRHNFGPGEWKNYGGAKTWPSPQEAWPDLVGRKWPPPEEWENTASAEVLSGGSLRLTSAIDTATGTRLIREFSLADDGDLTIEQTVEKLSGRPVTLGMWSVAQTPLPDYILMPDTRSAKGYHWLEKPTTELAIVPWSDGVLRVPRTDTSASDLAIDGSQAWMVSVGGGTAFAQRAVTIADGKEVSDYTGTFPAAFYCSGPQKMPYAELELLSPLHRFKVGSRWRQILHWRVEALPSPDRDGAGTREALARIVENLRKGS